MTAPARRHWLAPVATVVLLVLGTVALTLGLALALTGGDTGGDTSGVSPRSAAAAPSVPVVPQDAEDAPLAAAGTPVSELADPEWVSSTAQATGIPPRALAAYAGASVAVGATHPTCGLGWNTVAAIGLVESEHGTLGGTTIDSSGATGRPIIGVALDGDGVAEIDDTDGGRLDGDTTWDRAVGPMQFIPSTWTTHGTDGDADGTIDVHDIDDAALTAASYLCSTGGDLTAPDGWIGAVSAYNLGSDYHQRVAAAATRYADIVR